MDTALSRINELQSEIETTKEANKVVVDTKDSVLRKLVSQYANLTTERNELHEKVESMSLKLSQLSLLLSNLQEQSKTFINIRKGPLLGGRKL